MFVYTCMLPYKAPGCCLFHRTSKTVILRYTCVWCSLQTVYFKVYYIFGNGGKGTCTTEAWAVTDSCGAGTIRSQSPSCMSASDLTSTYTPSHFLTSAVTGLYWNLDQRQCSHPALTSEHGPKHHQDTLAALCKSHQPPTVLQCWWLGINVSFHVLGKELWRSRVESLRTSKLKPACRVYWSEVHVGEIVGHVVWCTMCLRVFCRLGTKNTIGMRIFCRLEMKTLLWGAGRKHFNPRSSGFNPEVSTRG